MFKNIDDHAVSPTIGVILMVTIAVILAAVIAAFAFGFGDMDAKGPVSSIQILNVPETTEIVDMKIVHKAGDSFKAGDWKISIVEAGDPPVFITAGSDFKVGDQIITTNLTNSGTVNVTNTDITVVGTAAHFRPDVKYDVKIIVYPYKTQMVDAIVMVR